MATYSISVSRTNGSIQELLDGLKDMVATHGSLGSDELNIQKQFMEKYIAHLSRNLLYIETVGHTARFLSQAITIREAMKTYSQLATLTEKMDKLVTTLLDKLNKLDLDK